jgi:hypothetical protein
MMRSAAIALPGTEFNDFLFAPIGEDSNGMLVSVLSGLARLEIDPWQEAAQLAQLPGGIATQKLASLIRTLHDHESAYPDPPRIAARLIALLPKRDQTSNRLSNTSSRIDPTISLKPLWIYVILMAFVLGTQFFVINQKPQTNADGIQTSSTPAPPQSPPADTGQ